MANQKFDIRFNISGLLNAAPGVNAQVLPLLAQAVRAVSHQTAANWQEAVHRGKMWSGEKDAYANSIKVNPTGDFSAEVVSDYKHAREIETGRPPRDLKKMLDTSLKVRRTKDGRRFLVIPMRHNTQGNNAHASAMPAGIHALAQAMASSQVTGQSRRPSGEITHLSPRSGMAPAGKQTPFLSNPKTQSHMLVNRNHYQWGQRLTRQMLKDAGFNPSQHRNMVGMYRFNTSTPGGGKSSAYLTFRVMIDGQSGWIVPAQPGQHLVRKVVDDMRPKAEQAFKMAVAKTVGGG